MTGSSINQMLIFSVVLFYQVHEHMASARKRIDLMLEDHTKQGKDMSDTIELLETIGRDASLRHAPADELASRLEQADASTALKAAVASGDTSRLAEELGHKPMQAPQTTQTGFEVDEPDSAEEEHTPAPDDGKPSSRQ